MPKFRFTRSVRRSAVKLLRVLGRFSGPVTTLTAILVGADVVLIALFSLFNFVCFEVAALYILGLETQLDKQKKS